MQTRNSICIPAFCENDNADAGAFGENRPHRLEKPRAGGSGDAYLAHGRIAWRIVAEAAGCSGFRHWEKVSLPVLRQGLVS